MHTLAKKATVTSPGGSLFLEAPSHRIQIRNQ